MGILVVGWEWEDRYVDMRRMSVSFALPANSMILAEITRNKIPTKRAGVVGACWM